MARASIEAAKDVIGNLMAEQERDRTYLHNMLNHTSKMADMLAHMREQEERRIDQQAAERKAEIRKLFSQLISVEHDRQSRIEQHLADVEGDVIYEEEPEAEIASGEAGELDMKGHNSSKADDVKEAAE